MSDDLIMAATPWHTNANLIADCAKLGYLKDEWLTLDATYGRGNWWKKWRPNKLVTNDINPQSEADHHEDFRTTSWGDQHFDAVAYDPPYIAPGGRAKSTISGFNARFGLHSTPRKPDDLQWYIYEGLDEARRIVRHKGMILVKCKNYVNGGKLWAGMFHTWQGGHSLGLELVDCLQHLSGTGPQSQTTQEHARQNYSTLLVFKRP